MTQEEKQLLLKDLCARLPYHPILHFINDVQQKDEYLYGFRENGRKFLINDAYYIEEVKPYLRPMSSITEEECDELSKMDNLWNGSFEAKQNHYYFEIASVEQIDWLNEHHLDYRGLILMGLALEAPEDMYKEDEK